MSSILIIVVSILVFLLPVSFFGYKKVRKRLKKVRKKSKPSKSYIYIIWNRSFPKFVYKLGKSTSPPSKLRSQYDRAHPSKCEFKLLWYINPTQLSRAEDVLKARLAERRVNVKNHRKEMFKFKDLKEMYSLCEKSLTFNNIEYYDLLNNNEYDKSGIDLKRNNKY